MAIISLTTSPSTLEHSAMIEIAMSMWGHRISHGQLKHHLDLYKPFAVDEIPLPNILRKRLRTFLRSMGDKIWDWLRFHSDNIFTDMPLSYPMPHLKHLVWHAQGTIDYVSTARNLLQDCSLSQAEKLNVAKVYFFREFIEETCPDQSKVALKNMFIPLDEFRFMLEIARTASGYHLLRIHKRMGEFLSWYFGDKAAIIRFTFPLLLEFEGSSEEELARTLLLGLGYGVRLPV